MAISNELEEIYANFWGLHDLPLQSKSIYAAILICEHMRQTWTLYLQEKDNFVDVFQLS